MDSTTKKMIARLMEETATRKLRWKVGEAPGAIVRGNDNFIPLYFDCEFKGQDICIYEVREKGYIEEQSYWSEHLVIGILDKDARLIWNYAGNDSILHELFNDVRSSVSNVRDFLDYFR